MFHSMRDQFPLFHPQTRFNINIKHLAMMKLTIGIATCFVLCSMLLLLPSTNILNPHKSHLTITTNNTEELLERFDEGTCSSRYQSSLYRKPSPHKPSKYLISKLRRYETLHKRCGPNTDAYNKATHHLRNHLTISSDECRYIVWTPMFGLGNRILSLISVFLYALLTDRVMLVDQRNDINNLFCEPFPNTSWLLPMDFPLIDQIDNFNRQHSHCYGTMLKNHAINSTTTNPSYLYLDIFDDSRDYDKTFFCEKDQSFLQKVPWLIVKSNIYVVPSIWLIPTFHTELNKLFPKKDTVFHYLSRYLLNPTNQVWGMVTRSYDAYLSRANETLGIQIRVFSKPGGYLQHVMDQIITCTQREKLLPQLATTATENNSSKTSNKLKAVLVTSLNTEYSERLSNMYWERESVTGEVIEVYQPSGEKIQQTDKKVHDQKALAEIYLLSLSDELVTSTRSTFGYVAQGLSGVKGWILYDPEGNAVPDGACVRASSMEPCSLKAPRCSCQAQMIKISPFVKYCEDRVTGLKLVDDF